jgi:low affinity Fe/Cu permease
MGDVSSVTATGNSNSPVMSQRISRILHVVGDVTSKAVFSALVAAGVAVFFVALAARGFPTSWEAGFGTAAAAVTVVMVFVIQHTQSRQQLATQLKLDELIRSSPQADDLLVHIERSHDEELLERERGQIDHHTALRED